MTLRYVFDQPEIVANCVAMLIPQCRARGFGKCSAIGVIDEDGKLIGVVVYNNWNPEAGIIEMHGAATHPRWLTRETMRHMYQYPFFQLGVQMIVQCTPVEDERLLRQLAAGNYTFIKVPRMFGRERDGVLCLLTREDWEANKFNQRFRHHIRDVPMQEAA